MHWALRGAWFIGLERPEYGAFGRLEILGCISDGVVSLTLYFSSIEYVTN